MLENFDKFPASLLNNDEYLLRHYFLVATQSDFLFPATLRSAVKPSSESRIPLLTFAIGTLHLGVHFDCKTEITYSSPRLVIEVLLPQKNHFLQIKLSECFLFCIRFLPIQSLPRWKSVPFRDNK